MVVVELPLERGLTAGKKVRRGREKEGGMKLYAVGLVSGKQKARGHEEASNGRGFRVDLERRRCNGEKWKKMEKRPRRYCGSGTEVAKMKTW